MSETITKVDDNTIKVTTNGIVEKIYSITDLLAKKAAWELNASRFEVHVVSERARLAANLADVEELIQKAVDVGVELP